MVTVAVSGGFDPVHPGHINLFEEASNLGDELVVILNNDNWLRAKKGYAFMTEDQRAEVLEAIQYVDHVCITEHEQSPKDMSVCDTLRSVNPDVFANGGDRKEGNVPEYDLCNELDIQMEFNVGGAKIESSSELVKEAVEKM